MSSSEHSWWEECTWRECTEAEKNELLENLRSKPISYAPQDDIQAHSETLKRFINSVLGVEWALITNESSLDDFSFVEDSTSLEEKIKAVFGVDVSDIEDRNLLKIFERIDGIV